MACGSGCGEFANRFQPEFTRQWKPENNNGCGCANHDNSCDTPSLARPHSALAKFEEQYGKVITTVTFTQDAEGHPVRVIEKTICPPKPKAPDRYGCCSVRYRVPR